MHEKNLKELRREQRLNVVEMAGAVKRSIHAELSAGGFNVFFNFFNELGCERVELSIELPGGEESQLGSRTRVKSVTDHLERVVDRPGVNRRLVQPVLLPTPEDHEH